MNNVSLEKSSRSLLRLSVAATLPMLALGFLVGIARADWANYSQDVTMATTGKLSSANMKKVFDDIKEQFGVVDSKIRSRSIETLTFVKTCETGPVCPVPNYNPTPGISQVLRDSAGDYVIQIKPGTFASKPICVANVQQSGGYLTTIKDGDAVTQRVLILNAANNTPTDQPFNLICVGPQ